MTQSGRNTLTPGFYFVATPIGNARDITLRALDVLGGADLIAAEDTRNTRRLMEIHGIPLAGRPLVSYHEHNATREGPKLVDRVRDGSVVAVVSDAGTPMVSDPGLGLARAAHQAGVAITAVPGASAPLAALTIAGMPTDRFTFLGFPPNAAGARRRFFETVSDTGGTLVFFESPKRIAASMADMATCFGDDRQGALCRELTKRFEEARRGTLRELADDLAQAPVKGELVVVVAPAPERVVAKDEIEAALKISLKTMSVRDAVRDVMANLNVPRKAVYPIALALEGKE